MTMYKKIRNSAAVLALLSAGITVAPSQADIPHLDDVYIDGSLCVGFDCVNGESYGFDTIRLKENNLRIHFNDTSTSASFPPNDWRIRINDTSNGGASYFAIEDSSASRTPFRVEAGAREHALYVESDGDVGIGTSNPAVDLTIVTGNTPTVRLEQDGSSGFTPQTYDVAANEANFFIRDVTNGSALVFRARPGAPADSIHIAANGDIGMGTASPAESLHVMGDTFKLENTGGGATLRMAESLSTFEGGIVLNADRFILAIDDGGVAEFVMDQDGNVTLQGEITTTGSCSVGCDAVFDADYALPSIEEHAELMFANKYLPAVGPTQSGPMNMTDKMIRMLNELEKAHIYIAQINDEKKDLQARLNENEERLAKLEAMIAQ